MNRKEETIMGTSTTTRAPVGVFTVGGLSNREESFLAWSLPYVFRDVEHATLAASTPAALEMLTRLEPHGMVGLGYAFAGMRHVLSLAPAATPQDLANKKIRAFPSPIYNDWWNANGAAPTAMPLSEADRETVRAVVADAQRWGYRAAIDADVRNLELALADGVTLVEADLAAFQALGARVREKYMAQNPLITEFHDQAGAL
jgi:TRAP-type transport system periplasmic protein